MKYCLTCQFEPEWDKNGVGHCTRYKSYTSSDKLYKDGNCVYYLESPDNVKIMLHHCPSWYIKETLINKVTIDGVELNICQNCSTVYAMDNECPSCRLCAAYIHLVDSINVLYGELEIMKTISEGVHKKGTVH